MAESNDPCKVLLKNVRLGYPALFRARAFGKGNTGDPAFQASFYLDKEDKLHKKQIDACLDAIDAAKENKWGNKPPKIKSDKIALRDGDKDEDPAPEVEGMMVVSARNKKKPLVLDRDKTELDESDGRPYGGCYVDAIVRFWAQDNEYGIRINCSLEAVRFRADGEAFGAAPVDADEFEDLEEDEGSSRRRSRRAEADDDEDRPSRNSRSRSRDEDEDEGDKRSSRRRGRDEDEDEGDKRSSRRRGRDEADGDDERPSRRRNRDEDADDEDRPSRNSRSRSRDEDEEDRPSRRRNRDHDDDV